MERNDIKEDLEYVRNYFAQVRAAGKPKEHLQRCIRTLKYPEVLRDAGFVSYNGEDLSWYKVLNHEVLQTVYLYSDCGRFPLTLEIGYGIHPLFIPAPVPQKVVTQGLWWNEVHTSIMLPTPQAPLAVNACVSCPTEGRHGIERLEEIAFSKFNQTQSLRDCYAYHKEYYQKWIAEGRAKYPERDWINFITSLEFVDEAIYMADQEMYPTCTRTVKERLSGYLDEKARERTQLRLEVLNGEHRDEYVAYLDRQKELFANKLEKKLGIRV